MDDPLDQDFAEDLQDYAQLNAGEQLAETRIWGTEINVQACVNIFLTFLEHFRRSPLDGVSFYHRKLLHLAEKDEAQSLLLLDCSHLLDFPASRSLYHQLLQFPQEIIPILDRTADLRFGELVQDHQPGSRRLQVRPFGLKETIRMRALDPEHIETLVALKGMVIRTSTIIPDLKQAFFRCSHCNHVEEVVLDRGHIDEPSTCRQCQAVSSMEIVHNRCIFTDKQLIRVQETPDEVPEGETPHTVTIFAFDDLVDTIRPGDRVCVTGILRALPRRVTEKMRTVRSVFKTFVDALHFAPVSLGKELSHTTHVPQQEDDDEEDEDEENGRHAQQEREESIAWQRILDTPQTQDENADQTQDVHAHAQTTASSDEVVFSHERIREFLLFAASGDAHERLLRGFAPSVWGLDDVKRGLLCLLFGGTVRPRDWRERHRRLLVHTPRILRRDRENVRQTVRALLSLPEVEQEMEEQEQGEGEDRAQEWESQEKRRGEINVLLCGDPGTSKSQLLGYVHKLAPRGIYTSGKGSSAVGLSASVVKDPETKDSVLESGALVLSDRGVCCIDEFDKMSDSTRAVLHEAMEQQTVSITKAGIVATLNARTAILAAANPLQSRYNPRLSVVENLQLPPTLLSRFDLIFLVLDKAEEESDRRLATHLVSLYRTMENHRSEDDGRGNNNASSSSSSSSSSSNVVDRRFLREYLIFARQWIFPELSPAAQKLLVQSYLEMRALGGGGRTNHTITATPRQLESLVRLSQSLAKMRLSFSVSVEDVQEARRLVHVATQTAATDPRTGTIDMDLLTTGRAARDREKIVHLAEALRPLLGAWSSQRRTVGQIRTTLLQSMMRERESGGGGAGMNVTAAEIEDALRELESEGVVQFVDRSNTVLVR